MTTQHNLKQLCHEWFEQVWNQRDDATITRLTAPQVVSHGLGDDGKPAIGVDQFRAMRKAFLSAFPDIKIVVNEVLVEGNKTAIRITIDGTHLGDGIGIPATNLRFQTSGIIMCHWEDGKIVEVWNEFDAAGMMRQLQAPTAKLRP